MEFREFLESNWKSFRPERQKEFSFMHEPGYFRKATHFIDPDYIDPTYEEYTNFNLYHVTTNLNAVKSSGRLKSRRELRNTVRGLSGDTSYEAPGMISTTYDYSRAFEIYEQIKLVAQMVRGQVPASTAFHVATENVYDPYDNPAIISVLKDFLPPKVLKKLLDGEIDEKQALNRYIRNPKDVYHFFQELESAITSEEAQSDLAYTMSNIGFAGNFEDMLKIDPAQVAIIQLVARKDADAEHIPFEKEIRFYPQDLRIVRYLQPC